MADKVVDASALAAVVFAEPDLSVVEPRIVSHRLLAPYLLKSELASVCVKKIRTQPMHRDTIFALFSLTWDMPIVFLDIEPLGALLLAERFGLSAYDASYLWLARHRGVELVTLDKRLAKAARAI